MKYHYMKSIGEQVRDARKEAKLTQLELAIKSNLTIDTINRIEKHRTIHTYVHTLQQIQKVLQIQINI